MTTFFHASKANAPLYIIPFAFGNLLGPWLLGPLFDSVGRKVMISATYLAAGLTLLITAWLFDQKVLSATTLTICWAICFFFASSGASAAYLTVSEIFPMETRAMAIALFYACGTGVAIAAPCAPSAGMSTTSSTTMPNVKASILPRSPSRTGMAFRRRS